MGQKVSDETTIAASRDDVWNIITDLEDYPRWAEGMLEAKVLSTDDQGYPSQASFKVDAKVAEVRYTLQYAYDDYDISWKLVEGDAVSQLDGVYVLTERDGGTHVRYSLEVDVDMPIPAFLKKRAAKQILDTGLRGLKQRAEAQA